MADSGATRVLGAGLLGLALGAAACAVPVPPSGGPADTTPPSLVASEPAGGTVRFSGDRVLLSFDEYVDERSVASSLTVTPAPARPPEVRYGGRSVEIRFREPLRDSTTYILALDSGFRDAHGAALRTPIQIAFSTGDVIDAGRLSGRVLDAETGRPAASANVFAYAPDPGVPPDSLPAEPVYRTQTDGEGRFRLDHLAERPFLVVAFRDANRNRRLDPGEPLAAPPVPWMTADSAGAEPDRPWILAARDAGPPGLRRTVARSSTRLELLFTEGVLPAGGGAARWSVADSAGSRQLRVRLADTHPDDPRTLVLRTEPMPAGWWEVRGDSAVSDSAGTVVASLRASFVAPAATDTSLVRFRGFDGDTLGGGPAGVRLLAPWASARVRWSDPAPADTLRSAIAVRDTSGRALTFWMRPDGGAAFRVSPDPAPAGEQPFDVSVRPLAAGEPDTTWTARFALAGPARLGELSGVALGGSPVVVELHPATARSEPVRRALADADGRFRFDRLPGGRRYRIRAFVDEDGDGAWSPGSPAPYASPEPLAWSDAAPPVRARWETEIPDTLRIGAPAVRVPPGDDGP
jgi:hypothetical protein